MYVDFKVRPDTECGTYTIYIAPFYDSWSTEHYGEVYPHVIGHASIVVSDRQVLVESIALDDASLEMTVGEEKILSAAILPEYAHNQTVHWTSDNSEIAEVDQTGKVTAKSEGTTDIWAQASDGSGVGAKCTVTVKKALIPDLQKYIVSFDSNGGSVVTSQTVEENKTAERPSDPIREGYTFKGWYFENILFDFDTLITKDIALTAMWEKVELDIGDILPEDYQYILTVNEGVIPEGIWTSYIPDVTYTGKKITFPELRVYDGIKLLKVKSDYTVSYKNNLKAGTASIVIKANKKGNYSGSKTINFTIHKVDLTEGNPEITVDALSAQESKKKQNPIPAVYWKGKKLKNKTDYTVTYLNWDQKSAGDYLVQISGEGNFEGDRFIPLSVAPGNMVSMSKLKVSVSALNYGNLTAEKFESEVKKAITLKNGKTELLQGTDYIVGEILPENRKVGTFTVNVNGTGTKYFGERTITVKITGISIADKKVLVNNSSMYTYTGKEIKLSDSFSLKYNGTELTADDYEILEETYKNNVNAGKASVQVKGKNNFSGTRTITYTILPDSDTGTKNITISSAVYTKGGSKPKVTVEGLIEGTDFTVKYENNKAVTTSSTSKLPSVTITFKGNYKGTVRRDFYINPKDISTVSISSKDKVYSSKANAWKSAPVLKDTDGKALKAGTDYEKRIVYTTEADEELTGVIPAGTIVKVTVTGKGNYTGTVSTTYRILETGKDISKLTFKIANQEYTGSPVTIDEGDITSIKLGKKVQELVFGTDYIIESYSNNVNKGTAKVTFRGIGEYGGTRTVSFKIGQRSIVDYWNGIRKLFGNLF